MRAPLTPLLLGLPALCAVLLACPGPQYPVCEKDEHCAENHEVCVFGRCHTCALDQHCPEGKWCRAYTCQPRPQCTRSEDCTGGQVCRNRLCEPECRADGECAVGQACKDQRCVPAEALCREHSDCPGGQACRDGTCVVPKPEDPDYRAVQTADSQGLSGADLAGDRRLCGEDLRVFFGFNESMLTEDTRKILAKSATCLKQNAQLRLIIQGHTDERGSTEYNLALGERRAQAIRAFLKDLGVPPSRMTTMSLGEERPLDPGHDEAAWAKNRRGELYGRPQ